MGSISNIEFKNPEQRKLFVKHLISDIESLEEMVNKGLFESGIKRLGIEQELCLMDYNLNPMMKNLEVLEKLNDSHYTTVLAKFNLEINLDPREFNGKCFSRFENDLVRYLTRANRAAHKLGGKIILTGILPSIKFSDTNIENITPVQRYIALNEIMSKMRGKNFEFNIQGQDELITSTDSVLFESCNTSFQLHMQIDPDNFKNMFNWSQVISAPVLAVAVNSPMFLGKRLWKETRIALFHQSTDIRKSNGVWREERPRVFFGNDWERGGIVEHHRENLSRFKLLVTREIEGFSKDILKEGKIPSLSALSLFNGTLYRWNRICYGVMNEKPHLRIEARYLPSGPTIVDEIANSAFWAGLLTGLPEVYGNPEELMDFDDVRNNFINAARAGITTPVKWISGKRIPVKDLIIKELIPIAAEGLKRQKINSTEIDKYLGIIKERVKKEQTGSHWILESYNNLKKEGSTEKAILGVTDGIYQRQKTGLPVHKWKFATKKETTSLSKRYWKIAQVMSNDLITVHSDELIDLVRNLMLWSNIRHIPVENEDGELEGIISSDTLLNYYGNSDYSNDQGVLASDIMERDPMFVTPETLTIDAIKIMRENELTCLPVVKSNKLVGLFTEKDYLKFSDYLMAEISENIKTKTKK